MDWLALTPEEAQALPPEDQAKVVSAALDAEYQKRSARITELVNSVDIAAEIHVSVSVNLACEQAAISTLKKMANMYDPLLAITWHDPEGLKEFQIAQVARLREHAEARKEKGQEPALVDVGPSAGYL